MRLSVDGGDVVCVMPSQRYPRGRDHGGSPSFCSGFRQMGSAMRKTTATSVVRRTIASIQVLRTVSIAPPRASRVILLSYQMRIGIFAWPGEYGIGILLRRREITTVYAQIILRESSATCAEWMMHALIV